MKVRTSRRTFIEATAAGLAGAALPASRAVAAPAAPDAVERRRLIELAHFGKKAPAEGTGGMAITSHPLATRAAVEVLQKGGNACDAALAASITQTVVEPHMTTITGCLSQMYFDQATGETTYVNGNVNTPMAPLPGYGAHDLATGRGVAVPGWWGGFEAAHDRHASLPRKELMADAIAYARGGFEMHPFLWGEVFIQSEKIGRTAAGREIFFDGHAIPRPGATLYQKQAADTLERLAEEGNDYFYRGDFAKKVCEVVQAAGGVLTPEDFERWEPRWQEPAWGSYRDLKIAGSPPPDNGGTHIIEMLHMLEFLDLEGLGPPVESAESLLQMIRISHLVYSEGGRQNDPQEPSAAARDDPLEGLRADAVRPAPDGAPGLGRRRATPARGQQPRDGGGRGRQRLDHPPLVHVLPVEQRPLRRGGEHLRRGRPLPAGHAPPRPPDLGLRGPEHHLPGRPAGDGFRLAERQPAPERAAEQP